MASNYPHGVSAEGIERGFGDGPERCGSCAHCLVRACDIDPQATGGGVYCGHCEELDSFVCFENWCKDWGAS